MYTLLKNETEGHSKFYEIRVIPHNDKYVVQARWGRIDNIGDKSIEWVTKNSWNLELFANKSAQDLASTKCDKGYSIEVSLSDGDGYEYDKITTNTKAKKKVKKAMKKKKKVADTWDESLYERVV